MQSTIQNSPQRPKIITLLCACSGIGVMLSFAMLLSYVYKVPEITEVMAPLPAWYPAYLATSTLAGMVSIVGLWQMKRWAIGFYYGAWSLSQIALLSAGQWQAGGLLAPLLLGYIIYRHYKSFT